MSDDYPEQAAVTEHQTQSGLRRWYAVHKWTSLICTLFLLASCVTGLPLIFHDELAIWLGDRKEPSPTVEQDGRADLDVLLEDARIRRPLEQVQFVFREGSDPIWLVGFGQTLTAFENSALYQYDAHTGMFLHDVPVQTGLLHVLLTLHVELFAGLPGTLCLGFMGLLFVMSVLSGMVVYGPFMRKLPFGTVRFGGSRRLTWLDLHNLLGIVTLLWALVVGGTGVINTLARPLFALWQMTELAEMTAPWKDRAVPAELASLNQAATVAGESDPERTIGLIAMPGTSFAGAHHYAFFMRGTTPLTARLLKPILIDAETLRFTESRELPWYLTGLLLSQPLHFGDYGGPPLKVIWALLDLITIVVLISGLYLWWKKRALPVEDILRQGIRPSPILEQP